jgi:hypothetical protein
MLAENRRVLDRVCDGELVEVDEIDARLATLEVHYAKAMHELKESFESTRGYLIKQRSTRLKRAADAVNLTEAVAPVDEILATKGYADVPLSGTAAEAPADWLREIVTPEATPLSAAPPNGNDCSKGYAGVPLSVPPSDAPGEEFEDVVIGDDGEESAGASPALTQLDCALSYAALGQPVFPTKPDKSPYTARGFKEATTNEATIRAEWKKHPDAGIGIPTGKASGLLVLDRDDRHGGDASLSALIEQHGDLPPTQQASTPSGGAHYAFKYPEGLHIGNSAGKIGKGLDIRGEGGYIVAPGCDPARRWENALYPADPPEWMIEALLSEKHAPVNTDRNVFHSPLSGGRIFHKGERDNGLRDVAYGRWLNGWAESEADLVEQLLEVNATRCVPPLDHAVVVEKAQRTARIFARGEQRQQGGAV